MPTAEFFRQMPKVELHVHLEGSIRPATLLKLAAKNGIELPAHDLAGLQEWYRFRDFPHFVDVYVGVSKCIRTAADLELVAREFLEGQAEQNVLHTEFTYTASTIEKYAGIPWAEQHQALTRAMQYGEVELGVSSGIILDIVRGDPPERGLEVARWATESPGVAALGLAGEERFGSAQYAGAFALANDRGLRVVPHAGETLGPDSVWEVLEHAQPLRIGHGVRCLEDKALTAELVRQRIPLEVCPTSNVALGVFPDLQNHPLPQMINAGLVVTINSDDPPMFGTTLSEEFKRCADAFGFDEDTLWSLSSNAVNGAILPQDRRDTLRDRMRRNYGQVTAERDSVTAH
ncbi:MAG: adenosine deaminase [Fimbriimonadaceae bacterium]